MVLIKVQILPKDATLNLHISPISFDCAAEYLDHPQVSRVHLAGYDRLRFEVELDYSVSLENKR